MSQSKKTAASASGPITGGSPAVSMKISWSLLDAMLLHLGVVADEQELEYANVLGAMGMRRSISLIREHIQSLSELPLTPQEAEDYCGYSVRHLRRVAQNRGTVRKPVYRLADLPVRSGHTPRLPADLGRERAISRVEARANARSAMARRLEVRPVMSAAAAPTQSDSARGTRTGARRGTTSQIEARAAALARGSGRRAGARATAA